MLDFAVQKAESFIGRAAFMLVIVAIGMLGLVWLSIAATGWLSALMAPPLAAAITGGLFAGLAGLAYAIERMSRQKPDSPSKEADPPANKNTDVISRATSIAERMAPDSPLLALVIALVAGIASVHLPASITPFLNKVLDEVENRPDGRLNS